MVATTLKFPSLPVRTAPRGAEWAANVALAIARGAHALSHSLAAQGERIGRLRARQEMLRLAQAYENSQPGFASDLRAAATRADIDA